MEKDEFIYFCVQLSGEIPLLIMRIMGNFFERALGNDYEKAK